MGTEFFILALLFGGSLFYLGSPFFEKPVSHASLGQGSVNFCPQCGTKRGEGSVFCIHCGKKLVLSFFLFLNLIFSPAAMAQDPSNAMPPIQGMEVGLLQGNLFVEKTPGKKEVLPDFVVALMVFQDGKRILMLDKKTDAKGFFEFKNIFKDPAYTYTVGTIYEDMLYLIPNLTLKKEDKVLKVDFVVGPKSPHLVGSASEMMKGAPAEQGTQATPNSPRITPTVKKHDFMSQHHQKLALGLSILAIVFVVYLARRKT